LQLRESCRRLLLVRGHPSLQEELAAVVASEQYSIDAFFSPMLVSQVDENKPFIDTRFSPWFDHWSLISENQTLARELMGRPLPTQGFQVLAFALSVGFREIYLSGVDLYASSTERYSYPIPDRVAKTLRPKDVNPGYEKSHGYDRDISFYSACKQQFPDARIFGLSESDFLRAFTLPLPSATGPVKVARPKYPAHQPGVVTTSNGVRARLSELSSSQQVGKMIDGKRCAFVTLVVGDGFRYGAQALASSLAKVTDVPLVVLCLPETDKTGLLRENVVLLDVDGVPNPNKLEAKNQRFLHTYSKLRVFELEYWDRLVYVDADAIVLKNIDDLFALPGFAAAPDLGLDLNFERFNSGVFSCSPSAAVFADMLESLSATTSYDGGDQGFLNEYFPQPRYLDRNYNVLKRLYVHHPALFRWDDVKVLHYVGVKPWDVFLDDYRDARYEALEERWFSFLSNEQLLDLAKRGRPAKATRNKKSSRSPASRKLRKLQRDPVLFVEDSWVARVAKSKFDSARSFIDGSNSTWKIRRGLRRKG
jgi:hypothetical protein